MLEYVLGLDLFTSMGQFLKFLGTPLRGTKLNNGFISIRISEANFDECSLGDTSYPEFRCVYGYYNNIMSSVMEWW